MMPLVRFREPSLNGRESGKLLMATADRRIKIQDRNMEKLMELQIILKDLNLMFGGETPAAATWVDASRQAGVDVAAPVSLKDLLAAVDNQLQVELRR